MSIRHESLAARCYATQEIATDSPNRLQFGLTWRRLTNRTQINRVSTRKEI
jgi:hypothetical protein